MIVLTTKPTPVKDIDCKLVSAVLEYVDVGDNCVLTYHFLDGSIVTVAMREQAEGDAGPWTE